MFVDRVRIWAKGGKGGDGCCSFRREKFVPMGGPDGGDGGEGGSVILKVDSQLNNLVHLRYQPHNFAERGMHGKGAQKTGKSGKDIIIKVPPGTAVFRFPTNEENFQYSLDMELAELVADLLKDGETYMLAKGGHGGRGNRHFKSAVNQAPRRIETGWIGEQGQFLLELKSIADIGLVGFPNAGKSSLLAACSSAHPKIAPYPFTTLQPMIGVVDAEPGKRFSMADIPGLIEGAHNGVGLGHDFLRHIERCRLLVHVIDMAGSEGRDPIEDYKLIRTEIKLYDESLSKRAHVVVANKMDMPDAAEKLSAFRKKVRRPIFPVSAADGAGIDDLKKELLARLEKLAEETLEP